MDKNKVAIMTISLKYLLSNPGSFLQHWALREVYKSLGCIPVRVSNADDIDSSNNADVFLNILFNLVRVFFHYLGVKKYATEYFSIRVFRQYRNAIQFRKKYKQFIGALDEKKYDFDIVSVGGDQVLYPDHLKVALSIKSKKYIIYGASTNWFIAQNSQDWKKLTNLYLEAFDAVGIRERKGMDLLPLLSEKIQHVADPVMLLEPIVYKNFLSTKRIEEDFLFCYLLNVRNANSMPLNMIENIAKDLNVGLKMSGIQGADYYIPRRYYVPIDPCSFVESIYYSKYVITNSYHGTLLAILFHKPFISLKQHSAQNTRQQELLTFIGLDNHRIDVNELLPLGSSLLNKIIDWSYIDQKLKQFREESINWLREAII